MRCSHRGTTTRVPLPDPKPDAQEQHLFSGAPAQEPPGGLLKTQAPGSGRGRVCCPEHPHPAGSRCIPARAHPAGGPGSTTQAVLTRSHWPPAPPAASSPTPPLGSPSCQALRYRPNPDGSQAPPPLRNSRRDSAQAKPQVRAGSPGPQGPCASLVLSAVPANPAFVLPPPQCELSPSMHSVVISPPGAGQGLCLLTLFLKHAVALSASYHFPTRGCDSLLLVLFFIFWQKFPGQGSNPHLGSDLGCCSDTGSLTYRSTRERPRFKCF